MLVLYYTSMFPIFTREWRGGVNENVIQYGNVGVSYYWSNANKKVLVFIHPTQKSSVFERRDEPVELCWLLTNKLYYNCKNYYYTKKSPVYRDPPTLNKSI